MAGTTTPTSSTSPTTSPTTSLRPASASASASASRPDADNNADADADPSHPARNHSPHDNDNDHANVPVPRRPVKRRAAKACTACRVRKVRCDVMQAYHVTPAGTVTCSNCQMDGVPCVVDEGKRRRKLLRIDPDVEMPALTASSAAEKHARQVWPEPAPGSGSDSGGTGTSSSVNPSDILNSIPEASPWTPSNDLDRRQPAAYGGMGGHQPHMIYQNAAHLFERERVRDVQSLGFQPVDHFDPAYTLLTSASIGGELTKTRLATPPRIAPPVLKHQLPGFLKPLPPRMTSVDIDYLFAKGALSLPDAPTRNALLRAYIEYVHPYMPLVELHEVLRIIEDGSGMTGKMSLLLFQAIMFAGTAFVDMQYLEPAGFTNRKSARKAYFQRARVLYDFDYEVDRVSLVQSILLMTYWYETPNDQKDTWHWMGVAISLAHTIGMHRDPSHSGMEPAKKRLWKRIWWSCFMRDRLIALGMRRPTRIKNEDFDVPPLEEADFEIAALPASVEMIGPECALMRDVQAQRELAQMCIAKSKLCVCISQVLTAQYSVLVKNQGMGSGRSSVMLFPKKLDQTDEVQHCEKELQRWVDELPESCRYVPHPTPGGCGNPIFVHRTLLHMIYYTTLSALHRPQVLPPAHATPDPSRARHDFSRLQVREASREITRLSQNLLLVSLERFLPTTGVTVLLPAIIIHLLDIKSCNDEQRKAAMNGYSQCLTVLERLRDNYASADFATQFLQAAICKADLAKDLDAHQAEERVARERYSPPMSGQDASAAMQHSFVPAEHERVFAPKTTAPSPPDSEAPLQPVESQPPRPPAAGLVMGEEREGELNMYEFLRDDAPFCEELWTMPLHEGAHREPGGCTQDMPWVDQGPAWSQVGSPLGEELLMAEEEVEILMRRE
ncbi:uncharacterized protein L3040_008465 [Drepanopeziza brunnea f. sp. 'multigermtubi']|uniref:uncharacterized protein n=1 Tax=Drepanopeziza brunnea f. sp. 'multigermtubi' TaxID=698441 RepID=UPI00238802BF|nr:hypothetical protein L3040_008465 [Drepanopeziza brunnea f. sp. 'multigermtubi']